MISPLIVNVQSRIEAVDTFLIICKEATMSTKSYAKTRFSANDAALVMIDHQSGIIQCVHDYSPAEFRNNVMALAKLSAPVRLGGLFNSPVSQ